MDKANTSTEDVPLILESLVKRKVRVTPREHAEPETVAKSFSISNLVDKSKKDDAWDFHLRSVALKREAERIPLKFRLISFTEEKKYGRKVPVRLDEKGVEVKKAHISHADGVLFPASREIDGRSFPGGVSRIYKDERGNAVIKGDIKIFDQDGMKLETLPSDLHTEQRPSIIKLIDNQAQGNATTHDVMSVDVESRFFLLPEVESDYANKFIHAISLMQAAGRFYTFKFNYRSGPSPRDAFIQVVEEDNTKYLLMNVGTLKETTMFTKTEVPYIDMEDVDVDELEFEGW